MWNYFMACHTAREQLIKALHTVSDTMEALGMQTTQGGAMVATAKGAEVGSAMKGGKHMISEN